MKQENKSRRGFLAMVGTGIAAAATAVAKIIKDKKDAVITGVKVVTALTILVTDIQMARAATLDVEKKQLEIEGLKKDGLPTKVLRDLSDDEVLKIRETRLVKIAMEEGTETELSVKVK